MDLALRIDVYHHFPTAHEGESVSHRDVLAAINRMEIHMADKLDTLKTSIDDLTTVCGQSLDKITQLLAGSTSDDPRVQAMIDEVTAEAQTMKDVLAAAAGTPAQPANPPATAFP